MRTVNRRIGRHPRAALVFAIGLACMSRCGGPSEVQLPEALVGTWTTQAARYSDRFFELKENKTVVFGLGEGRVQVDPIVEVEAVADRRFIVYHIRHLNDAGGVYDFSLRYNPRRPDQLTLLNQPHILWLKEEAARPHSAGTGPVPSRGKNHAATP